MAGIVASVSFQIIDTDFWQHLLVGKAIWQMGRVPQEHLWTYPYYGMHEVLWSWAFRAVIWPIYEAGGIPALFGWRWLTTLAVFGLSWATARKMGARGLTPLVVIVWCSLVYRHRSQVRPETLAAVLCALGIFILELRRPRPHGGNGPDLTWLFVPVAWIYINVHISYFLLFLLIAFHAADELPDLGWDPRAQGRLRKLGLVAAAALAASFLNPFGWRAVWQPFDYALNMSHEPMFRGIGELQPLGWLNNQRNGVFLMLALWPVLLVWRARRHGLDRVELMMCAFFSAYMISSQRFFGSYALAAAPYLARDLDEWVRTRRWPGWTEPAWNRAALAALACVAVGAAEWTRWDRPLTISVDMKRFPVQAHDFMEQHGVRGHGFSQTLVAGYTLWRFWPDTTRLPFMDIHQTGTERDRTLYTVAFSRPDGFHQLDALHHFDYVVLDPYLAYILIDAVESDSAWSTVFVDDSGVLMVRRASFPALADTFGYRLIGAGKARMVALDHAWQSDSLLRRRSRRELERMARSSPLNATAHSALAQLAIKERRFSDARVHLEHALTVDPRTPLAHFRLAQLAIAEGKPLAAIDHFETERRIGGEVPGLELGLGLAWQLAGDAITARGHFEREIRHHPESPEARAAEAAMSRTVP